MKAIVVKENKRLSWENVERPGVGERDILIRVEAAALNRADLMQRAGDYPPPPGWPPWMGLEVAGTIAAMGPEALAEGKWKIGDPVCALLGGGGYAEYAVAPEGMVMPVPKGLTMAEAAALPEAFATAYVNLFIEGKMQPGETVLITAGGSGLASVMIPMAKEAGARVITTVRSDEKAKAIAGLGPDCIVNTRKEGLSAVLEREAEAGHPWTSLLIALVGKMWQNACLISIGTGGGS